MGSNSWVRAFVRGGLEALGYHTASKYYPFLDGSRAYHVTKHAKVNIAIDSTRFSIYSTGTLEHWNTGTHLCEFDRSVTLSQVLHGAYG